MLTSPDYINQKIVQNIETRLAAAAISKRSYEYAASFEDFLKIINNAGNLEELSLIRKSIVNDLMHATTIQNLQRAKGVWSDYKILFILYIIYLYKKFNLFYIHIHLFIYNIFYI